MSGYQVQTPNFFVNINTNSAVGVQLDALNQTVIKSVQHLYATGPALDADDIIGGLITITGSAGPFSIDLPTTAQIFEALTRFNASIMEVINVPATQRASKLAPKVGMTWSFEVMNDTADDIQVTESDVNYQRDGDFVFAGEIADFRCMITSIAPRVVVVTRCCGVSVD
jgi:hypothetical protein